MRRQKMKRSDQRGMASIIITMVTMVVISLIVVGFATISRREQRQSLDQMLSSQAFYAAESGIEDAKAVVKKAVKDGQPITAKTNCTTDPSGLYPTGTQMNLNDTYDVKYTCLKVDPSPLSVQFDSVSVNSVVIPITTTSPISAVKVTWKPSVSASGSPMTGCPSAATGSFTPQTKWNCGHGVLHVDAVPTGGSLTSASLANGLLSSFFVPVTTGSAGNVQYNPNLGKANVVAADCSAGTSCTAIIDTLPTNMQNMSLRLTSMYRASNVTVQALTGGNPLRISGVQATIDSTGRASDVLRRIQVRLPLIESSALTPGVAISSNGAICKRFAVSDAYFSIPSDITDPDTSNAMCNAKTVDISTPPPSCKVPHDIVFVLDRSGSMLTKWNNGKTRIQNLIDVTSNFIQNTGINPAGNHAAIVVFNDWGWADVELTGDTAPLLADMSSFDDINSDDGTSYGDGLYEVMPRYDPPYGRPGVPKAVIFISDGAPNDDYDAIYDDNAYIKSQGVAFYTVGIGDPGDPDNALDEQLLQDMAGNGGTYANATSVAGLQAIMSNISGDLYCN